MEGVVERMIYTDGVHLISDQGPDELHQFAQGIGLKREWYQDHRHPHYDILNNQIRKKALRSGARLVDRKQLVRLAREAKKHGDKN